MPILLIKLRHIVNILCTLAHLESYGTNRFQANHTWDIDQNRSYTQHGLPRNKTMPDIATITHVIFDFDGVILDSERVFSEANDRVLQKYGKSFNNDIKIGMMGRTQVEGARWVLESVGLAQEVDVTTYLDDYQLELEHLIKKADVLPGIRRLVEHLYAHGIPMAICTSSDIDEFNMKLTNCADLLPKMSHIVTVGSDPTIKSGKPAPDPYLAAMKRFSTLPDSPANVLVFEDSVSGVLSGSSASTTTIMVPQKELLPKTWPEIEDRLTPKVAEIIYSMEEFEPENYGLPAFRSS